MLYRMFLSWDLSNVLLMIRLGSCVLEENHRGQEAFYHGKSEVRAVNRTCYYRC